MTSKDSNVCAPDPGYHEGYKWALLNLDQEGVQADRARFLQDEVADLRLAVGVVEGRFFESLADLEHANKEREHLRIRVHQVEVAHASAERLREQAEGAMRQKRDACDEPHLGYATNDLIIRELGTRYEMGSTDPGYRTVGPDD